MNGPEWLAAVVATMVIAVAVHAARHVLRAEGPGYPVAGVKFACSVVLTGLLLPGTGLVGTKVVAGLWIAVLTVLGVPVVVTLLRCRALAAHRWRELPILLAIIATIYLVAAPSGLIARPASPAVSTMAPMSSSQMDGMSAGVPVVPGAPVDLLLALTMIATTVILIDRLSKPALAGAGRAHCGAVARSDTLSTSALTLACAYLLVMYFA